MEAPLGRGGESRVTAALQAVASATACPPAPPAPPRARKGAPRRRRGRSAGRAGLAAGWARRPNPCSPKAQAAPPPRSPGRGAPPLLARGPRPGDVRRASALPGAECGGDGLGVAGKRPGVGAAGRPAEPSLPERAWGATPRPGLEAGPPAQPSPARAGGAARALRSGRAAASAWRAAHCAAPPPPAVAALLPIPRPRPRRQPAGPGRRAPARRGGEAAAAAPRRPLTSARCGGGGGVAWPGGIGPGPGGGSQWRRGASPPAPPRPRASPGRRGVGIRASGRPAALRGPPQHLPRQGPEACRAEGCRRRCCCSSCCCCRAGAPPCPGRSSSPSGGRAGTGSCPRATTRPPRRRWPCPARSSSTRPASAAST